MAYYTSLMLSSSSCIYLQVQSGIVSAPIPHPHTTAAACSDNNCGGLGTKLEIKGRTAQVATLNTNGLSPFAIIYKNLAYVKQH